MLLNTPGHPDAAGNHEELGMGVGLSVEPGVGGCGESGLGECQELRGAFCGRLRWRGLVMKASLTAVADERDSTCVSKLFIHNGKWMHTTFSV